MASSASARQRTGRPAGSGRWSGFTSAILVGLMASVGRGISHLLLVDHPNGRSVFNSRVVVAGDTG